MSEKPLWADTPRTVKRIEPNTFPGPELAIALIIVALVFGVVMVKVLG